MWLNIDIEMTFHLRSKPGPIEPSCQLCGSHMRLSLANMRNDQSSSHYWLCQLAIVITSNTVPLYDQHSSFVSYFITLLNQLGLFFFQIRHQACQALEQHLSDKKKKTIKHRVKKQHVPKQRAKFTANQIQRMCQREFTPPSVRWLLHSAQEFRWCCCSTWNKRSASLMVIRHTGIQLPNMFKSGLKIMGSEYYNPRLSYDNLSNDAQCPQTCSKCSVGRWFAVVEFLVKKGFGDKVCW